MCGGVRFKEMCKNEAERAKREEKSVGFELFGLSLNPSISQAEVSSSPCGPPVFSPLSLWLELNLVRLSDKDFAMVLKAEGNKRSRKLIINVSLYHVYLGECKKFTEPKQTEHTSGLEAQ